MERNEERNSSPLVELRSYVWKGIHYIYLDENTIYLKIDYIL